MHSVGVLPWRFPAGPYSCSAHQCGAVGVLVETCHVSIGESVRRFVYVGPTLAADEVSAQIPGVDLRPPVRHGDLLQQDFQPGDRVLIIDGFFHQTGAVRHKEILTLLAAGVAVAGASSMGALRAAELDGHGMVGLGAIYHAYRSGEIIDDDEVTIVHDEGPDYRPLSVPLVNIRFGLRGLVSDGTIRPEVADALLRLARRIPYPRRSWRSLGLVAAAAEPQLSAAMELIHGEIAAQPARFDAKATDARSALSWLESDSSPDPALLGWATSASWRNRYLRDWTVQFRGATYDSEFVSVKDAINFAQIYDETFPQQWRRHVLSQILDVGRQDEQFVAQVETTFGLRYSALTGAQRAHWLTAGELADLAENEALVRILVRSVTVRPEQTLGLADIAADVVRCVAESVEVNRQVSLADPAQAVDRLRPEMLTAHLAATWRTSSEDVREMTAAARDRGLRDVDDAVGVAARFYLRHLLLVEPGAPQRDEDVALSGAGSSEASS
jgi:hypothetical protein